MPLTPRLNLRGGYPCWRGEAMDRPTADPLPSEAEIALVGAGVMGALVAERLARDGRKVALIDRRAPARGATFASTALVLWAADVPLSHLARRIGEADAAQAWGRVRQAVLALGERIGGDAEAVGWQPRPELYLAGSLLDEAGLEREARMRRRHGLPSRFLGGGEVADRFALPRRAALLSEGTFRVDPVALTLTFLERARQAGATVSFPYEVVDARETGDGVTLLLDEGLSLRAERVILATGYEVPRRYLPAAFKLNSTFAIATAPGAATAWRDQAMVWEAARPYLYGRHTDDGRVIVGGEDIGDSNPKKRDALLPGKCRGLERKGGALLGRDALAAECAWSATFGSSPDGLPAIGRARVSERIGLAYGFGGNGISFAALASELIAADLAGRAEAVASLFGPYR